MTHQIDDLFGAPPLIKGEDKERYMRIRAAVEADIKPQSIFDSMLVRDLTDKYWEELRYRRSTAALIDGAFKEALGSFVNQVANLTSRNPGMITKQYLSGDPKTKRQAALLLEQNGVTLDQIQAKAMQNVGAALNMLDRMISNREAARRLLRKDNERRFAEDRVPIASIVPD